MTTMRRRLQFAAEVWTVGGLKLTECFAIVDVETTRVGDRRERAWRGKLSSLSHPEHALGGGYRLRVRGEGDADVGSRIEIVEGYGERLGVTSDEYRFLGRGEPPRAPRGSGGRRRGR